MWQGIRFSTRHFYPTSTPRPGRAQSQLDERPVVSARSTSRYRPHLHHDFALCRCRIINLCKATTLRRVNHRNLTAGKINGKPWVSKLLCKTDICAAKLLVDEPHMTIYIEVLQFHALRRLAIGLGLSPSPLHLILHGCEITVSFFFFMYSVMCLNSQAGLRCGAANPPSNSFCLAHTGYGLSTATIPRSASVLSVVRPNRIDRQELTTPLCRVPAATQPTQFRGQNVWPSRRERECERFFYELPLNFF